MVQIELTEEEKEVLKSYFKTSPISLIKLKAQALIMRDHGMLLEEIVTFVFRDVRSIERWIKDFSEKRFASIFTGKQDNQNAAKLTYVQKKQ